MDKKLSKGYEKAPLIVQMLVAGTAACVADIVTFPTDTIKVRLQIQGEGKGAKEAQMGLMKIIANVFKQEGPLAFYNGLAAGLQRQMAFASIRIGIYDYVKMFYLKLFGITDPNAISIGIRILAGMTSGCAAAACAQPTDVVKIRFQAFAKKGGKSRYASTRAAYKQIYMEHGIKGLWQGVFPNMVRNAVCNVSEVVVYDIVKDLFLIHHIMVDGFPLHVATATITGIVTTFTVSPVDVIKTRYMNAAAGKYKSAVHCTLVTYQTEGLLAFYKGFIPNACRLISWNLVLWITIERFKIAVAHYYNTRDKQ